MPKKWIQIFAAILLFSHQVSAQINKSNPIADKDSQQSLSEQVKKALSEFGLGEEAKVKVKRKNGKTVKGFVVQVEDTTFTVRNNAGQDVSIPYDDVTKIRGSSPWGKIALWSGVGAAVYGAIFIGAGVVFAIGLLKALEGR